MGQRLGSAEVMELFDKISNWGRWGAGDERGALNLIGDRKRAAAARLAQSGEIVAMALPLAKVPAADNPAPVAHMMVYAGRNPKGRLYPFCTDYFAIAPHGFANTHIDALCHVFWKGRMYNGFSADEVGSHGALRCSIEAIRPGVVSRGVLLDIPKLQKVEWLDPSARIFPEHLDAAEAEHRVRVDAGDVLLIRTGRARMRKAQGPWDPYREGMPGLDPSCLLWLHERDVAILGCDAVSDPMPSGYDDLAMPIHVGTLVFMGVHLIDNADLDALASACKRLGRYEFMFCLAPLLLDRGTASPVTPLALF